jgi:hypothetical protein
MTLTGQDIGQAHFATRAVLERLLAGAGLGFAGSLVLNLLAAGPVAERQVVERIAGGIKVPEGEARAAVAEVVAGGLVVAGPELALTPAGAAKQAYVRAGTAEIVDRLYGGLPAEDLATARRVLNTVTERANAEL